MICVCVFQVSRQETWDILDVSVCYNLYLCKFESHLKKKQYSNIVFIYYTLKKLGAYESWSVQFFSYSEFSTIWLMNCLEIIAWSRLTWLRSSNEKKILQKKLNICSCETSTTTYLAREQIAIKTTHTYLLHKSFFASRWILMTF